MNRSFFVLWRHFFLQFFRLGSGSDGGGSGAALALSLLASPGAVMSFLLFAKYSPLMRFFRRDFSFDMQIASLPDKYVFIALSMTVAGIVAVLRWESLFPDRRDFANLAPLPLSSGRVLLAKALALTTFAITFITTVNICSAVLFPLIALEREVKVSVALRFIAAHAIATGAAGLWMFLAFLAVTGVLMSVLPPLWFQRARRYVQFAAIVALLLLFLSATGVGPAIEAMRLGRPSQADWLPSAWFLGLYQVLQGQATGTFAELGNRALLAFGSISCLAAAAYAISYRRFYLKSAEMVEGTTSAFPLPDALLTFAERLVPQHGFDRACLRFILQTLARSDRHTAAFCGTLGLGAALAVQSASDPAATRPVPIGMVVASLIVLYSMLTGLRLCLGLALDVRANWLFRLTTDPGASPVRVLQTTMGLFVLPVLAVPSFLFGYFYGTSIGLTHLLFSAVAALIAIDLMTADFRVVPFTCPWLPGRENPVFSFAVWVLGLVLFSQGLAVLDLVILSEPVRILIYLAVAAAVLYGLRSSREGRESLAWSDSRGELDLLRLGE